MTCYSQRGYAGWKFEITCTESGTKCNIGSLKHPVKIDTIESAERFLLKVVRFCRPSLTDITSEEPDRIRSIDSLYIMAEERLQPELLSMVYTRLNNAYQIQIALNNIHFTIATATPAPQHWLNDTNTTDEEEDFALPPEIPFTRRSMCIFL